MNNSNQNKSNFEPAIRRARIKNLTIYDVSEAELNILEKGTPDSIYLNFSIFLFSIAITFTVALITATPKWEIVQTIFIILLVIGYFGGLLLFCI